MRMEQTTHAPGQLRRILPRAAGCRTVLADDRLFAPLTLGCSSPP